MRDDPWLLVGWALLALLVIVPIALAVLIGAGIRNRRRAVAAFQRRREECDREIGQVRDEVRSRGRRGRRFELPRQ